MTPLELLVRIAPLELPPLELPLIGSFSSIPITSEAVALFNCIVPAKCYLSLRIVPHKSADKRRATAGSFRIAFRAAGILVANLV